MKTYIGLLGLALLGACSSDNGQNLKVDDKTITANDFESIAGWNNDPTTLDRGRAHSGQYAIKVDGNHEFSTTFDMPLALASSKKFNTVLLEGWAYLPSDKSTGMLGIQILDPNNPGKEIFGDGIRLGEVVKEYKKWVPVSKEFKLPDNINATQHIRMSLWRADASDFVLVDDVKISIKE
ncbi:hypothetical protein [Hymenobacter persicinus]|uniref:CBM11 domain-containing protein n=1 Tax=Hymenobacter persicinus TaxID=2025506 RepID=A0A4Q5L9I5_9BACT|nr:hypothetical protein [Hymenobacter persicinus]RYU78423.1 hypothetical protein EWM57_14100 [Hymenobacter persicinus]